MKITTQQIKEIINEELDLLLKEERYVDVDRDGWWDAKDVDFLSAKNGPVVFFDKDQEYNIEGRTHGVFSHLIRHMRDIGMSEYFSDILKFFREAITKALSQKYDMLYYDGNSKYPIDEKFLDSKKPENLIKIARITLDRISDDVLLGKEITDVEKEFISNARRLIKVYKEKVQDVIENHQVKTVSKENSKKVAYIKDDKIVVMYNDKVSTAYGDKRHLKDPQYWADKAVGNIQKNT